MLLLMELLYLFEQFSQSAYLVRLLRDYNIKVDKGFFCIMISHIQQEIFLYLIPGLPILYAP